MKQIEDVSESRTMTLTEIHGLEQFTGVLICAGIKRVQGSAGTGDIILKHRTRNIYLLRRIAKADPQRLPEGGACLSTQEIIASMARMLLSPCGFILVAHNEKAHLQLRNGISIGDLRLWSYDRDPIHNTVEDRFETTFSVRVCPAVLVGW